MNIMNESIRRLFTKVENHCISEIYKATDTVYYTEMSAINEWPVGGVQTPHLDTYSDTEKDEDPDYEQKINAGLRKSSRDTLSFWFTNDIMKSATQRPIENLDHNEYSVKKDLITPTYDVIRNNYDAMHRKKSEWRRYLLNITKK